MELTELQEIFDELQPSLMTVAEVAEHLNLTSHEVYRLIGQGNLGTIHWKSADYLFYGEVERYRNQLALQRGISMDVRYPKNQFTGVNPILHTLFHTGAIESTHKSFHAGYIGHIRDGLNDSLNPRGYRATCEDTLNIGKAFYPDVLLRHDHTPLPLPPTFAQLPHPQAPLEVATPNLTAVATPPEALQAVVIRYDTTPVTVIEFLSPSNLNRKEYLESYREKRQRILDLGVNMVELHFLPTYPALWEQMPIYPADPHAQPYQIAVTQPQHQNETGQYLSSMYLFGITQAIPIIALPLLNGENVACNFDAAYQETYQRGGGFGYLVNYDQVPSEIQQLFTPEDCAKIVARSQEVCADFRQQYPEQIERSKLD